MDHPLQGTSNPSRGRTFGDARAGPNLSAIESRAGAHDVPVTPLCAIPGVECVRLIRMIDKCRIFIMLQRVLSELLPSRIERHRWNVVTLRLSPSFSHRRCPPVRERACAVVFHIVATFDSVDSRSFDLCVLMR